MLKTKRIKIQHPTYKLVSVGLDARTPGSFDGIHYTTPDLSQVEVAMLVEDGSDFALSMECVPGWEEWWDEAGVYGWLPTEKLNEWLEQHGATEFIEVLNTTKIECRSCGEPTQLEDIYMGYCPSCEDERMVRFIR